MLVLRASFALFVVSIAVALEGTATADNSDEATSILTNSTGIETRIDGSLSVTMRNVITKLACFSCKNLFHDKMKLLTNSLKHRHAELLRSVCLHDEALNHCTKQSNEITEKIQKLHKTNTSILYEACHDTSICNDEGDERIRTLSNTTNLRNETSIKEWVKTIANDFIYAPIVDGALSSIMAIKEDRNGPDQEEEADFFDFKITKEDLLNKLRCFSCSTLWNKLKEKSSLQASFNASYNNQLNLRYGPSEQEILLKTFKSPFAGLSGLTSLIIEASRFPTVPLGFLRILKAYKDLTEKFDKKTACFKPKLCIDAVNQRVFSIADKFNKAAQTTDFKVNIFASDLMQLRIERNSDVQEALFGVLEM